MDANTNTQTTGNSLTNELLNSNQSNGMERLLSEFHRLLNLGKDYVQENPREAAGIAAAIAAGSWAVLTTKPGRKAFESAAIMAIPGIMRWLKENYESTTH